MGKTQTCCFRLRHRQLFIPMLMLLASQLFHAEGSRVVSGMKMGGEYAALLRRGGEVVEERRVGASTPALMRRWLIGSSPPRCERRCSSCGRCEAVQVPIVPQQHARGTSRLFGDGAIPARIASSRGGDDVSNYKPMTWKCKCGNLLFNP